MKTVSRFEHELSELINRCCMENGSNTPDFLLAEYLDACLHAFNNAIKHRDMWYGVELRPGMTHSKSTGNAGEAEGKGE